MGLLYNPAFLGYNAQYEIGMNIRTQWIGLDDSPSSFSIFGSSKIPNQNISFGGYIFRDQSETLSANGAGLTISYTLQKFLNDDSQLSLGFGTKYLQFGLNSSNLIARDQPAFESYLGSEQTNTFDIDFGFHFVSNNPAKEESFFEIGIAVQNLISQLSNTNSINNRISTQSSYNAYISYTYEDYNFSISPKLWINRNLYSPTRVLFGLESKIDKQFIVGLFYSNESTLFTSLGYTFKKFGNKNSNLKILAFPGYYFGSFDRGSGVSFDIGAYFTRIL
ncbi:MAG: type IX secretion system PorP/SprF family membrane protein [Halioglobus sp.]|jgi:type IX secretion system PorP/SprF family membrane protein